MATDPAVWTPPLIDIAGLTVAVAEPCARANGLSLLFVHGMWCGAWVWENYQRSFAALGYAGYALNLRGHNGSRAVRDVGRISVYDYVEDVREVSTALGNPILVGHSMGGLLVQKLAESCNPPAVVAITPGPPRGICALSTAMLVRTAIRHADAILLSRPLLLSWQEANRLTLNGLPCDEQAQVYERLTPESGRAALEVALLGVDVNESRFRCPMLLIAAGKDNTTPAKMVGKIARRYKVECRTYSDHGHMIIMEPGWERVARDMADWLNRVLKLRETQGGLP